MKSKLKLSWELFIIFLKIGSFTFGGGMAMLPLIQNEVVNKKKWVPEEEILDIFAISQSVPGSYCSKFCNIHRQAGVRGNRRNICSVWSRTTGFCLNTACNCITYWS